MSVRETALEALRTTLAAALPNARVVRNADKPEAAPEDVPGGAAEGLVIVRDGDPGEPDVTLGVRAYWWTHAVPVEAYVAAGDGAARDAALAALLAGIDSALSQDRTLGGVVQDSDWVAEEPEILASDGAETHKAAVVAVTLQYETPTPLG